MLELLIAVGPELVAICLRLSTGLPGPILLRLVVTDPAGLEIVPYLDPAALVGCEEPTLTGQKVHTQNNRCLLSRYIPNGSMKNDEPALLLLPPLRNRYRKL